MMRTLARGGCALLAIAACGTDAVPGDPEDAPTPPPTVAYLSPTEHLVRSSMALRGLRPTVDELARVAVDPDALPAIVDGYLASPEFGRVMRDLHAETLLTRVDLPGFKFRPIGPIATTPVGDINRSVWEEPLALIEHVITTDRPYTEIVTAPYTITDGISSSLWGTDYTGGGEEQITHYLDGRPSSGILSSSALYARHLSAGSNYHRGRANMLSSSLLCFDYLHADVVLDTSIDLSDPEVVSNAVRANPACAACHQSLDPLASFLWGFQPQARYASFPVPMWRPDGSLGTWETTNGRPPSLNGKPGEDVEDLGRLIADDPRFARCTAARFAGYFTQTDHAAVSFPWVARLTAGFVASNFDAKRLARDLVLSDEFRISHATAAATDDEAEQLHGMLHLRPEQLDTLMRDLTGVTWSTTGDAMMSGTPYGTANLLRSDFLGFRAIAGGVDSYFVTRPTFTSTTTSSLVLRTFAATAAGGVVAADFATTGPRRLLGLVTPATRDEPTLRLQLAELHARIYGALDTPDSEAVTETLALWQAALATSDDTRAAWSTTLTAMLSDLRVTYY